MAWHEFLQYLLPFLEPLLGLLILLSLGHFLCNKLMTFVKSKMDVLKIQSIQVHYHHLGMAEMEDMAEMMNLNHRLLKLCSYAITFDSSLPG